jgi:hypothetical protein
MSESSSVWPWDAHAHAGERPTAIRDRLDHDRLLHVDLAKARAAGFDHAEIAAREFASLSEPDFAAYLATHDAVELATPVGYLFLPKSPRPGDSLTAATKAVALLPGL